MSELREISKEQLHKEARECARLRVEQIKASNAKVSNERRPLREPESAIREYEKLYYSFLSSRVLVHPQKS